MAVPSPLTGVAEAGNRSRFSPYPAGISPCLVARIDAQFVGIQSLRPARGTGSGGAGVMGQHW